MPVFTRRWNDPVAANDAYRLLVCRYRPRGVPRAGEPWDAWCPELAPSVEPHAAAYGKDGPPIAFEDYARRYREEMSRQRYWIDGFAARLRKGESMTLLCSSASVDEARCHRTLLKEILEAAAFPQAPVDARVVRRRS